MPTPTFTIPTVQLDRVALTSDWHIPYHNSYLVQRMLADLLTRGITNLVIAGDFIDFPTLSRFEPRDIHVTVAEELEKAKEVLTNLADSGFRVYWLRGNHELRYFRSLRHQVTMDNLVQAIGIDGTGWLHVYEGEELYVYSNGALWLVSHPQSYNAVPLTVARKLQQKFGVNVATGHNHQHAYAYAPDGQHKLIELGGLFDPTKLAYLWRGGMSVLPMQQTGYWILDNGKLVMP